jgi:hypothetical protein
MGTDHIRYDLLAQDALLGVVRRVLSDAARDGLPGEHHFYVSFKTRYPGVKISQRLAEKYPDEITIVLQHQFWDLSVSETSFEVGLSFGNAPEKLLVPFEAVSGFFDPSVQFGLKFEVATDEAKQSLATDPVSAAPALSRANTPRGGASGPDEAPSGATRPSKSQAKGERKAAKSLKVIESDDAGDAKSENGEKVVSLDTFRKKK